MPQQSFELTLYKNASSIENSPAGSDYSLPCLSSDDLPQLRLGTPDVATPMDTRAFTFNKTAAGEAGNDLMKSTDSLPSSDISTASSPISPATSERDTYAIRPFPLLHLMLSPSFAAIRAMDEELRKGIDSGSLKKNSADEPHTAFESLDEPRHVAAPIGGTWSYGDG